MDGKATQDKRHNIGSAHHSLDHDDFRSQVATDKIHSEQTKRKDDEIDAV